MTAVQNKKEVYVSLTSKHILPSGFTEQCTPDRSYYNSPHI